MRVWVVVGVVDYEEAEVVGVLPSYSHAYAVMLERATSWDEVYIDEWEVGGASKELARARVRPIFKQVFGDEWRTVTRSDGAKVHVREHNTPTG